MKDRYLKIAFSVLFAVFSFLVAFCLMRGILRSKEMFQMFLFTGEYFRDVVSLPGGFADYLARFLVQFFILDWAGPAIVSLLLVVLQLLVWRCSGTDRLWTYALSFIPSLVFLVLFGGEYCHPAPVISVMLVLAAVLLLGKMVPGPMKSAAVVALSPVMYFLCGPVAVLLPLLLLVRGEARIPAALSALLLVCCPLAGQFIWPRSFKVLCRGVHYETSLVVTPWMTWMATASVVVAVLLPKAADWFGKRGGKGGAGKKRCPGKPAWGEAVLCTLLFAVLLVADYKVVDKRRDVFYDDTMRYYAQMFDQDWDGILEMAGEVSPSNGLCLAVTNLALAVKGEMGDRMFSFPQSGLLPLMPEYEKHHWLCLPTAEAFFQSGTMAAAIQYYFDSQDATQDLQKSAPMMMRLAQAYSIIGNEEVSSKYLEALKHTLFYSAAARNFRPDSEENARLRSWYCPGTREFFSRSSYVNVFRRQFASNKDNDVAFQYQIAIRLLAKDLGKFANEIGAKSFTSIPKSYAQAFILYAYLAGGNPDSLKRVVGDREVDAFKSFIADRNSGLSVSRLQKKWGDTYWFYYYYTKI